MELHGWDGGWYRRAYFDNGTPLGSSQNTECQIDALAQSWSVISEQPNQARAKDAMLALEHYLWRKEDGILMLLTPPFDKFICPIQDILKGMFLGYGKMADNILMELLGRFWLTQVWGKGTKLRSYFKC